MKPTILIHGKELIDDKILLAMIKKKAKVLLLEDFAILEKQLEKIDSKILIFQFSNLFEEDLLMLKLVKAAAPRLEILVIDNGLSRNEVIRTLRSGVKDYFRSPYNTELLVERVEALLKSHGNNTETRH